MERVSITEGRAPVIFIAPHGHQSDDINTAIIARSAATSLDGFSVTNNGWKRGNDYDYALEQADCNNTDHLIDVPADEFLAPIIRFKNRIRKKHPLCYMYTIHGMSNDACLKVKDNSLSMVVGFGDGNPPSYCCKPWMKDLLIYQCQQYGWTTYQGKPGGSYSAWRSNNLCQFFRKHSPDLAVHAMQLEIIYDLRDSKAKAQLCGECLADFIRDVTNYSSWNMPTNFKIKQF